MNEPATMERLNVFILLLMNVVTDGALIFGGECGLYCLNCAYLKEDPVGRVFVVSELRFFEGGPCRSGFCCL